MSNAIVTSKQTIKLYWRKEKAGWKIDTTHARILCLFFKEIKMVTSQARFKWTDIELSNLIKCTRQQFIIRQTLFSDIRTEIFANNFMKFSFVMWEVFFQLLAETSSPIILSHESSVLFFSSPINTGFLSILSICTSSLFLTSLSYFNKQYVPIISKIPILEYW